MLFEQAAADGVPLMVFVGNRHCIQIHTGEVRNLRVFGEWFNVLDDEFNLHLKTAAVSELWRVRKPSSDGIVTSWEPSTPTASWCCSCSAHASRALRSARTGARWPKACRRRSAEHGRHERERLDR